MRLSDKLLMAKSKNIIDGSHTSKDNCKSWAQARANLRLALKLADFIFLAHPNGRSRFSSNISRRSRDPLMLQWFCFFLKFAMLISWWVAKVWWKISLVLAISQPKTQNFSAHHCRRKCQNLIQGGWWALLGGFVYVFFHVMKRKNRACAKWIRCLAVIISKCAHPRSAIEQPKRFVQIHRCGIAFLGLT